MSNHLQIQLQRQHNLLCYFKSLSIGPVWGSNPRPPAWGRSSFVASKREKIPSRKNCDACYSQLRSLLRSNLADADKINCECSPALLSG